MLREPQRTGLRMPMCSRRPPLRGVSCLMLELMAREVTRQARRQPRSRLT